MTTMKDLYRCLDEYSPEMLAGVAHAWRVALPKGESHEQATTLAEAMLAPGALERQVADLSPAAREALAIVVGEGGAVPGHRIALRFGALRRLGPSRLAREEPWARPENAVEELFYRGLLVRTYGTVGDHYGELLAVPEQLLARVPPLAVADACGEGHAAPEPERVHSDGRALVEDLFAVLVHVRQHPLRPDVSSDTAPHTAPAAAPIGVAHVDIGPRLTGARDPERLEMIRRLLWRLKLVHVGRDALRPTPRARAWLQLDDLRRLQAVVLAWRDDPHVDELALIPTIRVEGGGPPHNPAPARRALLEFMARCDASWHALDTFVAELKRDRPDYLRPDGDYDGWHLRDAESGAYLTGFEAWDRIEGALARYLLSRPLRWLGIVEVGEDADGRVVAFRLTPDGVAIVSGRPAPVEGAPGVDPGPRAAIDDEMVVTIPVAGTMYERYQLERFSAWLGQDGDVARYAITEDSVWQGHNTGVKTEQIDHFLRRLAGDTLPPVLARNLLAWGGRFGRASLRRVVLLQTVDEATMQQIRGRPELRRLLGDLMGPTTCAVEERHVDAVLVRLKALGIWPRLIGEGPDGA